MSFERLDPRRLEKLSNQIERFPKDQQEHKLNEIAWHLTNNEKQAEIYFEQLKKEIIKRGKKRVQQKAKEVENINAQIVRLEALEGLKNVN